MLFWNIKFGILVHLNRIIWINNHNLLCCSWPLTGNCVNFFSLHEFGVWLMSQRRLTDRPNVYIYIHTHTLIIKDIVATCFQVLESFRWSVIRMLVQSFAVTKTTGPGLKIATRVAKTEVGGFRSAAGFLHVQSSHRGSFRNAGVFFRNDTVSVTSSPAFRNTCTCRAKQQRRFTEIHLPAVLNKQSLSRCAFTWVVGGGAYHFLVAVTPHIDPVDLQQTTASQLAASCHFAFGW